MLICRAITSNVINELSRNRLQSQNSYVVIFVAGHSSGFNILHHRTTFVLPENTSVLSGPTLFANVVLMSVCPGREFALFGLVER